MYKPSDKIFAKVKGHPHWPSRINLLPPDVHIPKGKYPIFFYGTHEVYFLAPKDIFPYEKFKHKYAIKRNKVLFLEGLREIDENPDILLYNKDPNAESFLARFYQFATSSTDGSRLNVPSVKPQLPIATPSPVTPPSISRVSSSGGSSKRSVSAKRSSKVTTDVVPPPAKRPRSDRSRRPPVKMETSPSPVLPTKPSRHRQSNCRGVSVSTPQESSTTSVLSAPTDSTAAAPEASRRVSILRLRIPPSEAGSHVRASHHGSPSVAGLSSSSPFSSSTSPSSCSNVTVEARESITSSSLAPVLTSTSTVTPVSTRTPAVAPFATDPLRITIKQVVVPTTRVSENNSESNITNHQQTDGEGGAVGISAVATRSLFSITSSTTKGEAFPASDTDAGVSQSLVVPKKRTTAVVTPLRRESQPPTPPQPPRLVERDNDINGDKELHQFTKASAKAVDAQVNNRRTVTAPKRQTPTNEKESTVEIMSAFRSNNKKTRKHKKSLLSIQRTDDSVDDDHLKRKGRLIRPQSKTKQQQSSRILNSSPFSSQSSPVDDGGESDGSVRPTSSIPSSTVAALNSTTTTSSESSRELQPSGSKQPAESSLTVIASPARPPTSTTPSSPSGLGVTSSASCKQQLQERQLKELDAEARLLLIDRAIKSSLVRGNEDVATCVDRLEMLDRMTLTLPVIAKCWTVVETIRKCRRYKRSLEVKIAAQRVFNKFLQVYATADKSEMDLAHNELMRLQERFTLASQSSMTSDQTTSSKGISGETPSAAESYTGPKSMADLFQVSATALAERRRQTSMNTDKPRSASPSNNVGCQLTNNSTIIGSHLATMATTNLCIDDIPLPEESLTSAAALNVAKSNVEAGGATTDGLTLSYFSSRNTQPEMAEEFEVLDEYDEEQQHLLQTQLQDIESVEQEHYFTDKMAKDGDAEEETEEGEVRDPVVSPLQQPYVSVSSTQPYHSFSPVFSSITQSEKVASFVTEPPVPYVPQLPQTSHHHSNSGTTIEMTPPQMASRAYIPHSLHPSNDPPPPYRPYVPSHSNRSKTGFLSIDDSRERRRHTNVSSPHRSNDSRRSADRDKRMFRSPLPPHSVGPPHRARSPHALPHPLEHYQRYLTTALVVDEDEHSSVDSSRGSHHRSHRRYAGNKGMARRQQSPSLIGDCTDDGETQPGEDLDARIARMLSRHTPSPQSDTAIRRPPVHNLGVEGHPLGSPPPPPPLPSSQRVFFTHRPPPQHQFVNHQQHGNSVAEPFWRSSSVPLSHHQRIPNRMSEYHGHPSDPAARTLDSCASTTLCRDGEMHFIGGGGTDVPPPTIHPPISHSHLQLQRDAIDIPPTAQSFSGAPLQDVDFRSPQHISDRRRQGSGHEKDRELYSMLGV